MAVPKIVQHNAQSWLQRFRSGHKFGRECRLEIQNQTCKILSQLQYISENSNKVILDKQRFMNQQSNTIVYRNKDIPKINHNLTTNMNSNSQAVQMSKPIIVADQDCIQVGIDLLNQGHNPLILNMASSYHPGGGWKTGAAAQEENLFRRTSYVNSLINNPFLAKNTYPLDEFGCIYSPQLFIFRGIEENGYPLLDSVFEISFIAAAMYKAPEIDRNIKQHSQFAQFVNNYNINLKSQNTKNNNMDSLNVNSILCYKDLDVVNGVCEKIRTVLRVGHQQNHDCLVLSAWGCGAYRNPPLHQAYLFKQVLNETEFVNKFDKIVFAILDDHNARKEHNRDGNLKPFQYVFEEAT